MPVLIEWLDGGTNYVLNVPPDDYVDMVAQTAAEAGEAQP